MSMLFIIPVRLSEIEKFEGLAKELIEKRAFGVFVTNYIYSFFTLKTCTGCN